jgi:acyl carrier protein
MQRRAPQETVPQMDTLPQIRKILRDSLNLGDRAERLTADSALLGGIPEFDSMAVVNLVVAIEAEFDVTVNDDELSAEVFATVGSLSRFVSDKLAQ